MSPPVQPEQTLPPQELARIQANVAKMRSQGAPESDVLAYLQHEDSLAQALPHNTLSPAYSGEANADNVVRSLMQGGSYGFGDEITGLTHGTAARDEYRARENAFRGQHPVLDAALKAVGGLASSLPVMALGPEALATLKGATLFSAGAGALSGVGEADGNAGNRVLGGVLGAGTGAAGGILGYGLTKAAGSTYNAIADRLNPERAVAKAAAPLVNAGKLAEVDAVAPGGASLANTAVPTAGMKLSRLNYFLRGIGASPEAGASAENNFLAQGAALAKARQALGDQMDALNGALPVDPDVRAAVKQAAGVLGGKAPALPKGSGGTVEIQDLRDALSRLRYAERQAVKRGTEANGANLHDISQARQALQSLLYDRVPGFEPLDTQYAVASQAAGQTDRALKTVQQSRSNYGANTAYKQSAGSLGGSLPKGHGGLVTSLLDHLFLNKAGAADATARLLTTPGGPELVQDLLSRVPRQASQRIPALLGTTTGASANALRGLLFSPDSTQ